MLFSNTVLAALSIMATLVAGSPVAEQAGETVYVNIYTSIDQYADASILACQA